MTTKDKLRIIKNWCDHFLPGMHSDDKFYAIIKYDHAVKAGDISCSVADHDKYEDMVDASYNGVKNLVWGTITKDICK